MLPVGPLMIEHRLIERMIAILNGQLQTMEDGKQIDLVWLSQVIEFLQQYADHCHHGKEEAYLFKALEEKSLAVKHQRILKELREEHNIARDVLRQLAQAAENASQGDNKAYQDIAELLKKMVKLYPPHIEKEDRQFFLPIMSYFSQAEKDDLLQQFYRFDQNLIHEHYRFIVERLEKSPPDTGNSPTAASSNQDIYECSVCGYQYNPAVGDPEHGIKPGTAFSELPVDWTCPLCRAGKALFNRLEKPPVPLKEDAAEIVKEYATQDIIVHWYPQLCSHAGKCWNTLPQVFKPQERPWIDPYASTAEALIRTIDLCPSQALKYSLPPGSSVDASLANGPGSLDYHIDANTAIQIRVIRDGPLLVEGPTRILDTTGKVLKESDRFVLCRCGKTKNPPFCDGSHMHKN